MNWKEVAHDMLTGMSGALGRIVRFVPWAAWIACTIVLIATRSPEPGPVMSSVGVVGSVAAFIALWPAPTWLLRAARIAGGAVVGVGGVMFSVFLSDYDANNPVAKTEPAGFIMVAVFAGAIAVWAATIGLDRIADAEAQAKHDELLAAIATITSRPTRPARGRTITAVAAGVLIGEWVARRRSGR